MVPAGNKAKHLSSVNHTTKTIHQFIIETLEFENEVFGLVALITNVNFR